MRSTASLARLDRTRTAEAVVLGGQRVPGPLHATARLGAHARIVRDALAAGLAQHGVERQRREHEAGRLDGVVMAVVPGDVVRLPVPGIDLRGAVRQRLAERHVGGLRPAGRLHDERARARD